LNSNST